MATVSNQASGVYHQTGGSQTATATSNVNQIELQVAGQLGLTKTPNVSEFSAGDIITYTLNITNNSSSFLTGVRIIDNLGGGNLAYVVGSGMLTAGGTTYPVTPVATNPLTFTLQQLNPGQSMTLVYKAQVIFNLPGSVSSITNSVQGIGYTSTGTITGNTSSTIQKKISLGLTINKTASQSSVVPNQNFNYILTLSNSSSTGLVMNYITDQLPSAFVLSSITVKIGAGSAVTLGASDYTLTGGKLLTITKVGGADITVPASGGGNTVVTISGHL